MTRQNKKPVSNSKTLKAQLLSVIAMLVVASVALSSATYAWFVNNTTATVNTMSFQATTAKALLVAVQTKATLGNTAEIGDATAEYTTYKNVVTNDDIVHDTNGAGWTNMFTMYDDSTAETIAETKKYLLKPASVTSVNILNEGFFISKDTTNPVNGLVNTFRAADDENTEDIGEGAIKRIPLSFYSPLAMDVYFLDTNAILAQLVDGDESAAELDAIKKAVRIAFVGDLEGTGNSAKIFQFADDDHIDGAGNNTDYSKAEGTSPVTESDTGAVYRAIATIGTEGDEIDWVKTTAEQTVIPVASIGDYEATLDGTDNVTVTAGDEKLFILEADVAKSITVYIWLEGVDSDCLSQLSLYSFSVNLKFAGVEIT